MGPPAHRRLKVQRPLLLNAPQQRPATIPQVEHVSAASARDHEKDVLGAHSASSVTISGIPLAAGSGAPSRVDPFIIFVVAVVFMLTTTVANMNYFKITHSTIIIKDLNLMIILKIIN